MSLPRLAHPSLHPLRAFARPRAPALPLSPRHTRALAVPVLPELLLAHPYPSAIVALTVLLRLTTTVPATLWQRARGRRSRELVGPQMRRWRDVLATRVAGECRRRGVGYDEYRKELKRQLAEKQAALHKEHRTHPTATLLLPLAVHVPLVLLVSASIRAALDAPSSALAAAHWLSTGALGALPLSPFAESAAVAALGAPDPTGALPLLGALGLFGGAELLGRRTRRAAASANVEPAGEVVLEQPQRARAGPPGVVPRRGITTSAAVAIAASSRPPGPSRKVGQPIPLPVTAAARAPGSGASRAGPAPAPALAPAPGEPRVVYVSRAEQLGSISTNSMRIGALLYVPLAMTQPAGLALYWTTSIVFTFFQNLVLDFVDQREADRAKVTAATAADAAQRT
ncbi:hypothetical protein Q5752_001353 [Cryptotrichosporon argae]